MWPNFQASLVAQRVKMCLQHRRPGFDPWVGKITWRNSNPFQSSCLENPVDRGAWWATVHWAAESDMTEWLSTCLHVHTHTYPNIHCSAVYNSSVNEATSMSIDRWMGKEVVVHIHNGILLGCKKKHIQLSSNEVDEPKAYYMEWSKSEREKQISFINIYMRDLERRYWWTYL